MKALLKNRTAMVLAIIVAGVIIGEFPTFEKQVMIPATEQHPHLVAIANGLVTAILAFISAHREAQT